MTKQSSKNWHVIYVRSKFERKVFNDLTQSDIQCYLPMHYQVRQWHDRKKKLLVPVFPGYVFVCLDKQEMLQVFNTIGFVCFISTNGHLDVISDKYMSYIMKILNGKFEVLNDEFREGQIVIIESGPLAGLEGTLIEDRQGSKFILHLKELNKYVQVDAKLNFIQKKSDLVLGY